MLLMWYLFLHFSNAESVDWCNLSQLGEETLDEKKHTIDVLVRITRSKNCQQMISRLQKIKSLDLSYQNLSDISILIESDLDILLLRGNPISDFSVLSHQKTLRILDISGTGYTTENMNLLPLSLETLYAEGNELQGVDFRRMCQQSSLQFVSLRNSKIDSVESFQQCRNVSFLGLAGNEISDISPIRGLKDISSLDLYGNPLYDCPVKKNTTLYQRCMEAKEKQWEKQLGK